MIIPISAYTPSLNQKGIFVPGSYPYDSEFFKEIDRIKSGYYQDVIKKVRSIDDHKERQVFKAQNLPSLTISCTCKEWRKTENVTSTSGLMVIDIDADSNPHITDWKALRDELFSLTFVLCSFLSASENGVAFIVKNVPSIHLDTFKYIELDLKTYKGIIVDKSGKDIVRLRFVSYDPELKLKENFEDVPIVMPTDEYYKKKKEGFEVINIKFSSTANSHTTFMHAVEQANKHSLFENGTKHNHMIRVASYCNHVGMEKEFCLNMFKKHYSETDTPWDHIESRVKNIYQTYTSQFKSKELPKPPYSTKQLRWLLTYVNKELLRRHIYEFGQETYIGTEDYTITVSSKLLAFFMHIVSPQYNWTIHAGNEIFTNEECKDTIPQNSYLDECNGALVWCDRQNKFPIGWE